MIKLRALGGCSTWSRLVEQAATPSPSASPHRIAIVNRCILMAVVWVLEMEVAIDRTLPH
jgi:hypothetical protein